MTADPPISSNVSPAISTERVGQYPEHHPGLAYAHMVSVVRGQTCSRPDENDSGDFQQWIRQLTEQEGDHTSKRQETVSTHNLGPIGISLSMDVVEDTLALGTYVTCMQNVLLHGQNLRSVKRSITDLNPNYQIFSDIARHDTDDIRSENYAG
jgi:hypothetical protein